MRHPVRTEAGQSLALSALTVLVLALATALTFSIGRRSREKIKLQALADNGAYSLAVAEARAFNFYALSNRAIVSHYVAMLSVASHQSYLSYYQDVLAAVAWNYDKLGAELSAQCKDKKCPCAGAACAGAARAKALAKLYRDTDPGYEVVPSGNFGPTGPVPDAPTASWGGAWWFYWEWQAKRTRTHNSSDPRLNTCYNFARGMRDHYRNRVAFLRYAQLNVDAQLRWFMQGGVGNGPNQPHRYDAAQDFEEYPSVDEVIPKTDHHFDGNSLPAALAKRADPQVQIPQKCMSAGCDPNAPNQDMSGQLSLRYYQAAVETDPFPHQDYDEALSGTRYPQFLTRRSFNPSAAHWQHFLNLARKVGGSTGSEVTEHGTSKLMSQNTNGIPDPGDANNPSDSPGFRAPYNYQVPDAPSALYGRAYGSPSDFNTVSTSGLRIAGALHAAGHDDDGFGSSFAVGAEDHGRVDTWMNVGCASGSCKINPGARFDTSATLRPGRSAVYDDPRTSAEGGWTGHEGHSFHIWVGKPFRIPGHDLNEVHGWYGNTAAEGRCNGPKCGLYQGHMQYRYRAGEVKSIADDFCRSVDPGRYDSVARDANPDNLWKQPRVVTMLYKPIRPNRSLPWDFDFTTDLLGQAHFTTTHSAGDEASVSDDLHRPVMGALAEALVYYHRPEGAGHDDWAEPPNLWNPFWRAKLHPVNRLDGRCLINNDRVAGDKAVIDGLLAAGHEPFNY